MKRVKQNVSKGILSNVSTGKAKGGDMERLFDELKTTQLACLFIAKSGGSIPYIKLLKLMYLSDRKSLIQWGEPITGDAFVSMKHGPVLSQTYNLVQEDRSDVEPSVWSKYISPPSNYCLSLRQACDLKELSRAEKKLVDDVFEQYGSMDKWDLVDLLHENLPEWRDPSGSASPISYESILDASGKNQDEISEIIEELSGINAAVRQLS